MLVPKMKNRHKKMKIDINFSITNVNNIDVRRRRTALSVSCPCLVFVRIFPNFCPVYVSDVRILSIFLSVRIFLISILSAVRIMSEFLEGRLSAVYKSGFCSEIFCPVSVRFSKKQRTSLRIRDS